MINRLLDWMGKKPLLASALVTLFFSISYLFFAINTTPEPMDMDGHIYFMMAMTAFPVFFVFFFIGTYFSNRSKIPFFKKIVFLIPCSMLAIATVMAAKSKIENIYNQKELNCGVYGCAAVNINAEIIKLSESELVSKINKPQLRSNGMEQILAINRLGELKSVIAVPYLIDTLDSREIVKSDSRASAAARALGNIQELSALEQLHAIFITERYGDLNYEITKAIPKFGDDAVAVLAMSLENSGSLVDKFQERNFREEVIGMLGEINEASSLEILSDIYFDVASQESDFASHALRKFGVDALPVFSQGIKSDNPHIKENAIIALGEIPWPKDISFTEQIEQGLYDEDRNVRLQSARALGRKRLTGSKLVLEEALVNEKNQDVKDRIQWVLSVLDKKPVQ